MACGAGSCSKGLHDIAARLSLSAKIVSAYKVRLMQKLGISNNVDLVRHVLKHGLVDSDPQACRGIPAVPCRRAPPWPGKAPT